MIEANGSFSALTRAVHDEIQRRYHARYDLPTASLEQEADPPRYRRTPCAVTGIDVSRWLADELRVRAGNGGVGRIAVDYMDGKGPRVRWFGFVVNPVDTLKGMQAKLTPDE